MRYPFVRRPAIDPTVRPYVCKQYLVPQSPPLLSTVETYLWSHVVGPMV